MSAELLIANMLRIAREDLDGALQLATSGNRNAIYLCEQAVEKVIRAVLTAEGRHAGITHRLNEMVDHLPDANPLKPPYARLKNSPRTRPPSATRHQPAGFPVRRLEVTSLRSRRR